MANDRKEELAVAQVAPLPKIQNRKWAEDIAVALA